MNDRTITIFNFNKDVAFTDEHITRMTGVLSKIASNFPQILDKIRWVLVDDLVGTSAYGDPEKYPINGTCAEKWRAFRIYPRGMGLMPHRIEAATNFEGTLCHELSHLLEKEFLPEWEEYFGWELCADHRDEWEDRPSPDGKTRRFFNKKTDEMAPEGLFPNQPEQCVNYYAKISIGEDMAESIACYLLDPERLKRISPTKFEIIYRHDKKLNPLPTKVLRVPNDKISTPTSQPETILYYIVAPRPKPIALPLYEELADLPVEKLDRLLTDILKEEMNIINDSGEKTSKRKNELLKYEQFILDILPTREVKKTQQDKITKLLIESHKRKLQSE